MTGRESRWNLGYSIGERGGSPDRKNSTVEREGLMGLKTGIPRESYSSRGDIEEEQKSISDWGDASVRKGRVLTGRRIYFSSSCFTLSTTEVSG